MAYSEKKVFQDLQQEARFQEIILFPLKRLMKTNKDFKPQLNKDISSTTNLYFFNQFLKIHGLVDTSKFFLSFNTVFHSFISVPF